LQGVNEFTDPHIIKLLATYQQEDKYHFLFPYAERNLSQYMAENPLGFANPDSQHSRRFVAWILSQVEGIAKGLSKIHTKSEDTKTLAPQNPEYLNPRSAERPIGSGYHHDLKPQNILHFTQLDDEIPNPEFGILQIADFGVAKFHSINSGTGTKTFRGTPTYAAPETKSWYKPSDTAKPNEKMVPKLSRPYDVWSLGCITMELLVWH
jgi:serine/threonine protein kinase